jgi:hypothetical protein
VPSECFSIEECVVMWCVSTTSLDTTHPSTSTALQLRISLKALGTIPEDGNVVPKHVEATIHN